MFIEPVVPQRSPSALANEYLIQYGPATRQAYRRDLGKWFGFCASVGVSPLSATRATVDLFQRHLIENSGVSRASVARCLAAISGLYTDWVNKSYVASNPTDGVKRPKVGTDTVSTGISAEELQNLIKRAKEDSPRAYALVMLLAFTGIRISEALNATVSDLSEERGHKTLKVTRKGGKTAIVPLTAQVHEAITDNLRQMHFLIVEDTPLFPTITGGRFHRAEAQKLLQRLGNTHPHALRHAFCTLSLDAGAPLHEVQDAMGHVDPRTTQRYNRSRNNLDNHPSNLLGYLVNENG